MHLWMLPKLLRDTSGNTLAIFAAALVPLTLMIGGGLDLGVMYMARAKMQNACDAGVLAARQTMPGNVWTTAAGDEADKFFDFNFPVGSHGIADVEFVASQDQSDAAQIVGAATGTVPTSLLRVAGIESLSLSVNCSAKRNLGHNDIVLVLDTTGSMNDPPSTGGDTKIVRLRNGASGLYRALDEENDSVTRFGIVSYSHTVNVGGALRTEDILVNQAYVGRSWRYVNCDSNGYYIWNCHWETSATQPPYGLYAGNSKYNYNVSSQVDGSAVNWVEARNSHWATNNNNTDSIDAFRASSAACIEERPSVGNAYDPIEIEDSITLADINSMASSNTDRALQFGRYDPWTQIGESQSGCPSRSQKLAVYDTENAFNTAISTATANVTGGTYHDVGMMWGLRFISRNGFFSATNPSTRSGITVRQHIVFMTDGMLDTGGSLYSSHGVENHQHRTQGIGSQDEKHLSRFASACNVAKSMGVTVWVIALDVVDTDDVEDCATTPAHFYTSNGSDLETVFEAIGQGIGNLRLTE